MTKIQEYLEANKEEYKKWLVDNEQGRIDIKILPYLQEIENGFFVEAGALDGLFMSNTKILEDLGWDGLLVEPQRKAAKKCRENRKCSSVAWCALVPHGYPSSTATGDWFFDGEEGEGAWSSMVEVGRHAYGTKAFKLCPAYPLSELLKPLEIKKVDFFSLDVEGYEIEVLKGIDFSVVEFNYILIEINNDKYTLDDMIKFMSERGFKCLANLSNFTNENLPSWNGEHQDYLFKKNG